MGLFEGCQCGSGETKHETDENRRVGTAIQNGCNKNIPMNNLSHVQKRSGKKLSNSGLG